MAHTFYRIVAAVMLLTLTGCSSNEDQLKTFVNKMNCTVYPKQLGDAVWIDSLSVMPGITVGTYYSFTNMSKNDFTPEMLEAMRQDLRLEVLKSVISDDKEATRFRNAGVTFYFDCRDWEGNTIFDITVTPEEYKQAMKR